MQPRLPQPVFGRTTTLKPQLSQQAKRFDICHWLFKQSRQKTARLILLMEMV